MSQSVNNRSKSFLSLKTLLFFNWQMSQPSLNQLILAFSPMSHDILHINHSQPRSYPLTSKIVWLGQVTICSVFYIIKMVAILKPTANMHNLQPQPYRVYFECSKVPQLLHKAQDFVIFKRVLQITVSFTKFQIFHTTPQKMRGPVSRSLLITVVIVQQSVCQYTACLYSYSTVYTTVFKLCIFLF